MAVKRLHYSTQISLVLRSIGNTVLPKAFIQYFAIIWSNKKLIHSCQSVPIYEIRNLGKDSLKNMIISRLQFQHGLKSIGQINGGKITENLWKN